MINDKRGKPRNQTEEVEGEQEEKEEEEEEEEEEASNPQPDLSHQSSGPQRSNEEPRNFFNWSEVKSFVIT
ncbi:hypothetical protein E2C01_050189 [Portunus trituberculatus]|uniref:Uncharacterized protein n=1 Tax=Portunus trituberculatus TaxID=210409 RepID=A0A5B7GF80_PORTR|nr:hypothetical protein [Portunus trituberculatus]